MNALSACPFPTAWTPRQIAGAVKPPGFELGAALARADADAGACRPGSRDWHSGYLRQPALSTRFRMHG